MLTHATPSAVLQPFIAAPKWSGVVSIDRPDHLNMQHVPVNERTCRVASARAIEFNGCRAILIHVPWPLVKKYFQSDDEDQVFVAASLRDEHLEFHECADFKEWAHYSAFRN